MTLPGKLTICYLEEDVPQKAYFRIKPLFIKGDGAFEKVENAKELLPDEGGIRIVPDKNESSRFKARMRTLGKFCALDLTKHPNENDKIRSNKNYSPERMETNRNIVYSDVIEKCPDEWLVEAVRVEFIQDGEARAKLSVKPETPLVALIAEGKISGPYTMTTSEDGDECIFALNEAYETRVFDESAYTRLYKVETGEDSYVEILMTSNGAPIFQKKDGQAAVCEEEPAVSHVNTPETPVPAPAEAEEKEEAMEEPAPAETPSAPEISEEEAQPEVPEAPTPVPQPAPVMAPKMQLAGEPVRPAAEEKAAKAEDAEKRRPVMRYQREQALLSQTGLNPRRGRSLSEVVDDGWRKSRLEQLGAPVPGDVTGQPVISPIERAAESFKAAWALKEARSALLDEILSAEDVAQALAPRFSRSAASPATGAQIEQLNDLEAERLKILGEIDELRLRRMEKRAELMEEARQVHAAEVQKMEADIARLKAECEKRLRAAEDARDAQSKAVKLMGSTMRDAMKEDFVKYSIHARAAEAFYATAGVDENDYAHSPKTYEPTGAQLVSDIRKLFEESGNPLSNDEAVNLLACLALGDIVVISGKTGSGKSALVRELAAALGLNTPGMRRFACLNAGEKSALDDARFRALTRYEDMTTLRILMLDDANALPNADQARGLITWAEESDRETALRVVMTVMDDQIGYPMNPRVLDRAFMIRLNRASSGEWGAKKQPVPNAEKTVSLSALKKIFSGEQGVPGEVANRLRVLMEKLEKMNVVFSARALSDMYAYCAACIPLMTCPPKQVLDYALSQRAIPHLLATAKLDVLKKLPELLCDMPMCLSLMNQPLPLPPV